MSDNGWGGPGDWRDTEFGAGQERYYGDHLSDTNPRPDPAPAPVVQPPAGRGRWAVVAGAAVLAVALTGAGVYLGTRPDDRPTAAGSATSGAPTPTPSAAQAEAGATDDADAPQRNSGGERDHAAFDVPPAGTFTNGKGKSEPIWKMYSDPRDIAGYGSITGKNLAMGHAPTEYREGFCATTPNSGLGLFVWADAHGKSPAYAASDTGDKWLKAIATRDDNKLEKYDRSPSVKNVTLAHSKTKAVQFRARTPLTAPTEKACGVSGAEVVVTAFETGQGTATLVVVRRLGHPASMTDQQQTTILNSLRPT